MAALVQSFPQQSTVSVLQTRPSPSNHHYQASGPVQQRSSQMYRTQYGGGQSSYRGHPSMAPVAPYAFKATPQLSNRGSPLRQNSSLSNLRQESNRTGGSAPVGKRPVVVSPEPVAAAEEGEFFTKASDRPVSTLDLSLTDPRLQSAAAANLAKASPDRYRRNQKRTDSGNVQPAQQQGTAGIYNQPFQSYSSPALSQTPEPKPVGSKDDSSIVRASTEQAKRYRRRSITTFGEDGSPASPEPRKQGAPQLRTYASVVSGATASADRSDARPLTAPQQPVVSHSRNESDDSAASSRASSRPTSSRREGNNGPTPYSIPPRGSSDANKRLTNPSPLSRPFDSQPAMATKSSFADIVAGKNKSPAAKVPESPAAQQLAALNQKEGKKMAKQSRLRRAFSFGSAAELKKVTDAQESTPEPSANAAKERGKLQKDQFATEEEALEAAIVQKQEASGLGSSIYSGQGHFYTGSTDNLSISSTASSASMMLRKMGKGVKRSTKSFVGLFRPKSVVGVPTAEPTVSEAELSMVTVEAEREKVNVNANPHDQVGGGTGFPKLERNSIDAGSYGEPSLTNSSEAASERGRPRQSIVGGERERQEVLAAVKKGILKRTGTDSSTSSPYLTPQDQRAPVLPQVPRFTDSPHSSAPPTPTDGNSIRGGHRKTDSITLDGEDYFITPPKITGLEARSYPGTPRSVRNITFSPRIQFHDTWPSGEYDRRGEIATCNRLTPMLAQAIKEELNSFKMEMEVHESSKVYTHFF